MTNDPVEQAAIDAEYERGQIELDERRMGAQEMLQEMKREDE